MKSMFKKKTIPETIKKKRKCRQITFLFIHSLMKRRTAKHSYLKILACTLEDFIVFENITTGVKFSFRALQV